MEGVQLTCILCGKPIENPRDTRQIAKQVVGFDVPRAPGAKGGQHALARRQETGSVAHVVCVRYRGPSGPSGQQERLWSE